MAWWSIPREDVGLNTRTSSITWGGGTVKKGWNDPLTKGPNCDMLGATFWNVCEAYVSVFPDRWRY